MDIFKAKNYEEIGGSNGEPVIEVGEGIDVDPKTLEDLREQPLETIKKEELNQDKEMEKNHSLDDLRDQPLETVEELETAETLFESKDEINDQPLESLEEKEIGQMHAVIILEPQQDGSMEMTPVGGEINKAPEMVTKEINIIKNNVIDKDMLASRLKEVTNESLDNVMGSVELLTGMLDKLRIPYDKSKNLVVEDRNGAKTAYCLTDVRENEQNLEEQNIPDAKEVAKNENRVRDVSSIDMGEMHAIINAENKDKFNKIIDNINDSRENMANTREQMQQTGARMEKETKEQGGFEMTR